MIELPNNWWALVVLGLCAGVVSGMLGIGSGVVVVPALVLLFSLPQKSAQGVCLVAMLPIVLMGAIRYKLNPDIDVSMVKAVLIGIGGIVGAFIGVEIAARVPNNVLRKIFAIVLFIVALKMMFKQAEKKSCEPAGIDKRGILQ